jgi:hypothetical protein
MIIAQVLCYILRPLFMGTRAREDCIIFDHECCVGSKSIFNLLKLNDGFLLQIVGLCQALNDVLDSMGKKGIPVPV